MSEISMTAGGYRYGGTLQDAPARGKPRRRRAPLTCRVLEVIREHGGEASTTEIRRALEASGTVPGGRQVPDALHRLAKISPPEVTAVGDPRGGWGKAQRWRLTPGGDRP